MASLGKLVSLVLLKTQINFHVSGPAAFDIELCRRSFQLLALASLMASFASPFLPVLMESTAEVVSVVDPRLWFFAKFGFDDVK